MTLDNALRDWALWSNQQNTRLSYPQKSVGFSTGGINCWDDLADQVDSWLCNAIDASIHDLLILETATIYTVYCNAIYRHPRDEFDLHYQSAMDKLSKSLSKKGVVLDSEYANISSAGQAVPAIKG